MFHELRAEDTIQVAIKLESLTEYSKYLAIVGTVGSEGHQEGVIIGFHCTDDLAHIGLILPLYKSTEIVLDGDGGFRILTGDRPHIFKPVSVQAMWSALLALKKVCLTADNNNHIANGPTHGWLSHYTEKLTSDQPMLNEWDMLDDLMVTRADSPGQTLDEDCGSIERQIRLHLREMLEGHDLEDVTSLMIRLELEKKLNRPLKEYRSFIDQEMLLIVRQLDASSKIFDFVYLGSEWNASNLVELQTNGVGYILNVTKEIDNFFPGMFKYMNIRLYDNECSDLMRYWENTHRFICRARDNKSSVLIHCKMGVSRSASTVIAFAMKEYGWSLQHAIEQVEEKRSVIKPNDSFMQQLQTYEGILNASKQRWNPKFKSDVDCGFADQSSTKRDSVNSEEQSEDNAALGSAAQHLDEGNALVKVGESDSDYNQTVTDSDCSSDTENSSTASTSSYHLEEDDINKPTSTYHDDGQVVGLHYNKLNTNITNRSKEHAHETADITSLEHTSSVGEESGSSSHKQLTNERGSSNLHPSIAKEEAAKSTDSAADLCKSNQSTDIASVVAQLTRPHTELITSDLSDDISVCYGVVQKTKEQIAVGLPQSKCAVSAIEDQNVPVTPGTVRKALGKIEHRAHMIDSFARSASFRIERKKLSEEPDIVQRSSSVKMQKQTSVDSAQLNQATSVAAGEVHTTDERRKELLADFSKIRQQKKSDEAVQFTIGERNLNNNSDSALEEDMEKQEKTRDVIQTADLHETHPTDLCHCSQEQQHIGTPRDSASGCRHVDCILRVASKPILLDTDGEAVDDDRTSPSPMPVRALVGAFEDIGATNMNRPLTIHVDSFTSDPFAHDQMSSASSTLPLKRSQSLRTLQLESKPSSNAERFDIKTVVTTSAQKILKPYWKIKRDNAKKLMHSFSTDAVSSEDVIQ